MPNGMEALQAENEDLRMRLEEAEETLSAIRSGVVDALVIGEGADRRVYTLDGADRAYRVWVEQMQQGAATLQMDGTIVYANRRLASLLGEPHERLPGRALRDFVISDDQGLYDEMFAGASPKGGSGEFILQQTHGQALSVLLSFNPLPAGAGASTGVLVTDLTAQKHHERLAEAHAALKESEEKFRLLFTSMDEGFCVIEVLFDSANRAVDYRFLETNPAFEKQCGLLNAVGRTMRDLVPDHDGHWFEMYGKVATTGKAVRFVNEAKALDGRWFDVYAFRPGDHDIHRVAITFTDITDRVVADDITRFLSDASAALVELADRDSALQRIANLAATRFADLCFVDIQDDTDTWRRFSAIRPEPARSPDSNLAKFNRSQDEGDLYSILHELRTEESELVADVSDARHTGISPRIKYLNLLRARGVRSYLCVPLLSRSKVIGAMTFLKIEAGRRFGTVDQRAAEDLARRVTIAVENAQLYQALQDADKRKDEFLATLAHELRNPLAPVRTGLQVLNMSPPAPAAAQAREMMERQLTHMVRLIDDLLDVSRISRGKVELRRDRVDLRTVIQNALEISRPVIEAGRHELTVSLREEPVWLDADLTRLAQVVGNVLTNAAKYTPQGGRIELVARREANTAVVSVRDTGVGIPLEMQGKVFDLFAQVNTTLNRSQGGLGIGLSLVKRLVEMHAGTVEVESAGEGQGSMFTIRMPVILDSVEVLAPQLDGELNRTAVGRRILVVDDNRDAADSLAMMLRLYGHVPSTAYDGPQALAAARASRPEIVLLDIGLPGMSGYEVAGRFRADPDLGNVVLIALTGWGGEEDKRRTKDAGFDFHLTKPVEPGSVSAVLARFLPRRA